MNIESVGDIARKQENERRARESWHAKASSYKALFTRGNTEADMPPELAASADIVMRDLQDFCCANRRTTVVSSVTGVVDPMQSMILDGRREVFLRIQHMLGLTSDQVRKLAESTS